MDRSALVSGFLSQMGCCGDADCLKDVLEKFLRTLGFPLYYYNIGVLNLYSSTVDIDFSDERFVLTNFPRELVQRCRSRGYERTDPVRAFARKEVGVVFWRDLHTDGGGDPRPHGGRDEILDAGCENGVTISLVSELGDRISVSVIPERQEADFRRTLVNLTTVAILAQGVHRKAKGILLGSSLIGGSARRKSVLSSREADVLGWLAKGKTAWEAAQILQISQKSVEFYADTARAKLHASNRTHAVVKAITMGLIPLEQA